MKNRARNKILRKIVLPLLLKDDNWKKIGRLATSRENWTRLRKLLFSRENRERIGKIASFVLKSKL